jgi:hypothetical protein
LFLLDSSLSEASQDQQQLQPALKSTDLGIDEVTKRVSNCGSEPALTLLTVASTQDCYRFDRNKKHGVGNDDEVSWHVPREIDEIDEARQHLSTRLMGCPFSPENLRLERESDAHGMSVGLVCWQG